MRARLHRFLHEQATRILTAPLGSYQRSSGQDIDRLKLHLRKGDVVLVCGDQRVSEVIRYLTQSSWSHSAIYIGDELHDLSRCGGWDEMGKRVTDDVLDAFAVVSPPDRLVERLRARAGGAVDRLAFTAMLPDPEQIAELVRRLRAA